MCDNTHRILPTRDAHPSLGVQTCTGAPSHRHHWLPVELVCLQPLWTPDPKSPPYITLLLSCLAQGPRKIKMLLPGRIFQGLRAHLPEAEGKGQISFWAGINSLVLIPCKILAQWSSSASTVKSDLCRPFKIHPLRISPHMYILPNHTCSPAILVCCKHCSLSPPGPCVVYFLCPEHLANATSCSDTLRFCFRSLRFLYPQRLLLPRRPCLRPQLSWRNSLWNIVSLGKIMPERKS